MDNEGQTIVTKNLAQPRKHLNTATNWSQRAVAYTIKSNYELLLSLWSTLRKRKLKKGQANSLKSISFTNAGTETPRNAIMASGF